MKFIARLAEYVGYRTCFGERINEWRCPNKKCGIWSSGRMGVLSVLRSED